MDLLSSNALPVENPLAQKPFSQLDAFAQQLRSSGTQLGRSVQTELTNMETSLSLKASVRCQDIGRFNSGVGTEGVDSGPEGPQVGEAACSFYWLGSESTSVSVSSEVSFSAGGGGGGG